MNRLLKDLRATHTTGQLAQLAYGLISIVMIYRRFGNAKQKVSAYRALNPEQN